ncbi:MAG: FAD-dependent thymidylate synthase [Aigarchaeota archaeon]|nr:FAD-dependent thymidylate synthase [Aigarchaeota archaeon]MDW8093186.1 FAD-dependent thymidylate synthase [Nitrososphaerota archaeon]
MRTRYTDQLEVEILSYGPVAELGDVKLQPDEVVALEGVGTFEGVSVKKRAERSIKAGKDLKDFVAKVHYESTRRGHASLSTSLTVFYEVRECSRLLSLLLVSPPFGSHLQESQRRFEMTRERLLVPAEVRGTELEREFNDALDACYRSYKRFVSEGVEIEDARYVLPLSSATSLFSAVSFEAYVHLLKRRGSFPLEVGLWAERFSEVIESISPMIFQSRLSFDSGEVYYPISNPFRPPDDLIERVAGRELQKEDTVLLELSVPRSLTEMMMVGRGDVVSSYATTFGALTIEGLSLVALHQAIRHRTVPTSVESVHAAASRTLRKGIESGVVVPPSLKSKRGLVDEYLEACRTMLELYEDLKDGGYPIAAPYALPQSLVVFAIRRYNLFNLIYPTGFVATRTCSYAQWEERAIAYRVWREIATRSSELSSVMGEKCKHLGYCPEKSWCPIILKYVQYSDEEHERRSKRVS